MRQINKKRLFMFSSIAIMLCIVFFFLRNVASPALQIKCKAHLISENNISQISLFSHVIFEVDRKFNGNIYFEGYVDNQGVERKLSRNIKFNYKLAAGDELRIFNIKSVNYSSDKVGDSFFSANVFDLHNTKVHRINIRMVGNSLLLGNELSPFLMCVKI